MGCCEGKGQSGSFPSPQLDQPSQLLTVYWGRFVVRVVRIHLETLLKAGGRIRVRLKKKGILLNVPTLLNRYSYQLRSALEDLDKQEVEIGESFFPQPTPK